LLLVRDRFPDEQGFVVLVQVGSSKALPALLLARSTRAALPYSRELLPRLRVCATRMERPYRRGALLGGAPSPSVARGGAELRRHLVTVAIVAVTLVAAGLILGAGDGLAGCQAGYEPTSG
jgi:hypothetical protein